MDDLVLLAPCDAAEAKSYGELVMTSDQSVAADVLSTLRFEMVPSEDGFGGPVEYRATEATRELIRQLVDGEKTLLSDSGGISLN